MNLIRQAVTQGFTAKVTDPAALRRIAVLLHPGTASARCPVPAPGEPQTWPAANSALASRLPCGNALAASFGASTSPVLRAEAGAPGLFEEAS